MSRFEWRAGFEIEVILGDLDDPRFADYIFDPMDCASAQYCQAVAKRLTRLTSFKWSAPKSQRKEPGFYVLPEYDLDPINWPDGRVAGVELVTPPLALREADSARAEIVDAIEIMDGFFNTLEEPGTEGCAWHINIDPGPRERISVVNYLLGVDELGLLLEHGRYGSSYASPQRHAWGLALMRHIQEDRECQLLQGVGFFNLLRRRAGRDKSFACNFEKLILGYVELRHFSAGAFFSDDPLEELLSQIVEALQMSPDQSSLFEAAVLQRSIILREWLKAIEGRLEYALIHPSNGLLSKMEVTFDGVELGALFWNGSLDVTFKGSGLEVCASLRGAQLSDASAGIAVLAMDFADMRNSGHLGPSLDCDPFSEAIAALAESLSEVSLPPSGKT
ncbi:MAG: hypothetical protein AAFP15_08535 [Bacteroidota bacterium]